ncbi:MAG: hypothetical protein ACK52U_16010 [Synechococcaceae cyanobacterium]
MDQPGQGQLAVGLGLDHPQQQPIGLVAVLVWIQLQQRLGKVVGGDQVVRCHRQRLAEAFSPSRQVRGRTSSPLPPASSC